MSTCYQWRQWIDRWYWQQLHVKEAPKPNRLVVDHRYSFLCRTGSVRNEQSPLTMAVLLATPKHVHLNHLLPLVLERLEDRMYLPPPCVHAIGEMLDKADSSILFDIVRSRRLLDHATIAHELLRRLSLRPPSSITYDLIYELLDQLQYPMAEALDYLANHCGVSQTYSFWVLLETRSLRNTVFKCSTPANNCIEALARRDPRRLAALFAQEDLQTWRSCGLMDLVLKLNLAHYLVDDLVAMLDQQSSAPMLVSIYIVCRGNCVWLRITHSLTHSLALCVIRHCEHKTTDTSTSCCRPR
jgi:hypothetical protein